MSEYDPGSSESIVEGRESVVSTLSSEGRNDHLFCQ